MAWAALPACLPFFGFGLWIVDLICLVLAQAINVRVRSPRLSVKEILKAIDHPERAQVARRTVTRILQEAVRKGGGAEFFVVEDDLGLAGCGGFGPLAGAAPTARVAELRAAVCEVVHGKEQVVDLAIADVGAVDADSVRPAGRQVEHVAATEQHLGAVLVEDRAGVGLRRHGHRFPHPGAGRRRRGGRWRRRVTG